MTHMLQAMERMEKKGQKTSTSCCSTVKKTKKNAKEVTQAERSVIKCLISEKTKETCECELCKSGEVCSTSHFVYRADCKQLGDQYIGASRRPLKNRHQKHESSFRLINNRTTLGQSTTRRTTRSSPIAGTRD